MTEFIAYAKAHPKELNYGSVGVGSSQHLAAAYFEQITGIELTHVPYRNIAQYTPDFLAGQVPLGFQLLPNVLGLLNSGDARALAVTSDKRMTALPDVPTAAEAGVKNYETFAWLALLAPAGTPKPIVDKIYDALAVAVKDPAVKKRFIEQGAEPVSPGPEALAKFIGSETVKWARNHRKGRNSADVSDLTWLFRSKCCERMAWKEFVIQKKNFSAKRLARTPSRACSVTCHCANPTPLLAQGFVNSSFV